MLSAPSPTGGSSELKIYRNTVFEQGFHTSYFSLCLFMKMNEVLMAHTESTMNIFSLLNKKLDRPRTSLAGHGVKEKIPVPDRDQNLVIME